MFYNKKFICYLLGALFRLFVIESGNHNDKEELWS